jgi:ribosomal protein L24
VTHILNKTENLSNKITIPFYIAASKPGTYLSATIGESPFANYQPDENTVGMWHLEEENGSSGSIIDSSGNDNNGTPTGTNITEGNIGKARSFSGSSQYITIGDTNSLKITGNQTIDMWLFPTNFSARRNPWAKAYGGEGTITQETNGTLNYYYGEGGGNAAPYQGFNSATAIPAYQWSHIAIVRDLDNKKLRWYINGVLTNETNALYNGSVSTLPAYIGTGYTNVYAGMIDEVRISNVARTSEEIKQVYSIKKRTHPVTIDFAAGLDNSNLIDNLSDTSFTIDATKYGLIKKGSNIYVGDKIIVKEGNIYIAQGTVNSVDENTGAITVNSWDSGSKYPNTPYTSGFSEDAQVFKWQREYFDISDVRVQDKNSTSLISFRLTNGHEGRTIWLDDAKAAADYLTTPLSSAIVSTTGNRYVQYRTIFTTTDAFVSSSISKVTMDGFDGSSTSSGNCYLEESSHDDQITIHWDDNATGELGFEIEKRINGTIWNTLDRTSANITTYNDDDIFSGNTYQYRVRSFSGDGATGTWCATSVVDLGTGSFRFEGLQMEGIKIN